MNLMTILQQQPPPTIPDETSQLLKAILDVLPLLAFIVGVLERRYQLISRTIKILSEAEAKARVETATAPPSAASPSGGVSNGFGGVKSPDSSAFDWLFKTLDSRFEITNVRYQLINERMADHDAHLIELSKQVISLEKTIMQRLPVNVSVSVDTSANANPADVLK